MEWPFVGRDGEIQAARDMVRGPTPHGVIIVGPAGVGKTRLAREVVEDIRSGGFEVEWAKATSGTASIPFGALSSLLPSFTTETIWAMFRLAREAILERSQGKRPLVIAVDDVHLLDEPSAALIYQVTQSRLVVPLLTRRTPEPVPEPITALWKEDLVSRLVLDELSRESTDEILNRHLGEKATAIVKNRAWDLSRGNPLLLRELVLMGLDSTTDRPAHDMSDRLFEIVAARIAGLPDESREVLEMVAVSNPLEVTILERLGDRDALAPLEERQLLEVTRDGQRWLTQFSHPLHGEVIRAGLPRSRLRAISAELSSALNATGLRRRNDAIRAATLQLDSDLPLDHELMLRGAREALAGFAHALAERLARAAHRAGAGPDALLVLGEALSRSERGLDAEKVFAEAETLAQDEATRTRARVARAQNLAFVVGEVDEARTVVARGLAETPEGPPAIALRVSGAWAAALGGSFRDAIQIGQTVSEDESATDEARLQALVISTLGLVMVGQVEDAQRSIDVGLDLARKLHHSMPFAADLLKTNRFMGHTLTGELAAAEELAVGNYEQAVSEGAPEAIALWAADRGFLLERRGDFVGSLRYMRESIMISERHDPYAIRGLALGWAAIAAAQLGRRAETERLVAELEVIRAPQDLRTKTVADRASVWLGAVRGDLEGAATRAAQAGRANIDLDFLNWGLLILHEAVRLGYPHLVAASLDELAGKVDGPLVKTMSRHAAALQADDPAALHEVGDRFLDLGYDVYAMEAHAQASHLLGAGDPVAGGTGRGHLAALRSRHPEVATPALRDLPALLTKRETQIALLAPTHTSPEIADKLSISVRTVDNHLASVYTKLGVEGRNGLAEVLDLLSEDS